MYKNLLFVFSLLSVLPVFSQHCPWDCSGLILLQTGIPKERLYQLQPVLVDENKKEIINKMYRTEAGTRDAFSFLTYEDFTTSRIKNIKLNNWYRYDTAYHFAKGKYLVRYNHCDYYGKKLYLRFTDPYTLGLTYRFIEIPESKRIHLHSYSGMLNKNKINELKDITEPFVLKVSCEEWKLRTKDCK